MLALSELVPGGKSVQRLQAIATKNRITILAGLFEKDEAGDIYKAYVCVDKTGLLASHRKLHPFVNKYIQTRESVYRF